MIDDTPREVYVQWEDRDASEAQLRATRDREVLLAGVS